MQALAKMTVAVLLALSASAPASSDPGCMCRYNGGEIAQGQTMCIVSSKGSELARCEKVLNLTSWKFLGQPCPDTGVSKAKANPSPQVS